MGRWELIHLFFLFCIIQYLSYGDVVDSTRWEVKVHGHTLSKHGKKDKQTLDCSKIGKWCPSVGTKIFDRNKVRTSDPKNIEVEMKFAENCICPIPDKKKKFCKELLLQGGGESFFITSMEIRHMFRSWICTTKIQKFQEFISPCVVQANCAETPRVQKTYKMSTTLTTPTTSTKSQTKTGRNKGVLKVTSSTAPTTPTTSTRSQTNAVDSIRCKVDYADPSFNVTAILNKTHDKIKKLKTLCPWTPCPKFQMFLTSGDFQKISVKAYFKGVCDCQISLIEVHAPKTLDSWICADIKRIAKFESTKCNFQALCKKNPTQKVTSSTTLTTSTPSTKGQTNAVNSTRWEVKVHGNRLSVPFDVTVNLNRTYEEVKRNLSCLKTTTSCPTLTTKVFSRDKVTTSDPNNVGVELKFDQNCHCQITSIEVRHMFKSWICPLKDNKILGKLTTPTAFQCIIITTTPTAPTTDLKTYKMSTALTTPTTSTKGQTTYKMSTTLTTPTTSTKSQTNAVNSIRCKVVEEFHHPKRFDVTAILNKRHDKMDGKSFCSWTPCPEFTTDISTESPKKIIVYQNVPGYCYCQISSIEIHDLNTNKFWICTDINYSRKQKEYNLPCSFEANCKIITTTPTAPTTDLKTYKMSTTLPTPTTSTKSQTTYNMSTTLTTPTTSTKSQTKALCYSGWINVNDSCYRIINRKTDIHEAMNNCYDDLTMETEITEELRNQIGYDENVWIRKNGSIQACNLGNLSCTTSGRFNSLCSMAMLNDSMILDEPVRFFEAPWMIPNTKKSLDIIKKQYSISSPQDGMWIGLYKSGNQLFWIDNSFVSETEKRFLNISDSLTEGECAMYKGSVILTDCSLRKRGLTLPLLSVPCCSCAPRPPRNTSEFKKGLKEISVKKKETSKYKRSKTSAPDERTSSKAIATVAALVISIPFAAIVISDIPILTYQFREFCRNVRRRFQRTES